jgi:hypothetical protein
LTDARIQARSRLWRSIPAREHADPEQRGLTTRYAEGLLDACEHTGLLDAEELKQWRGLLAGSADLPPASGDIGAADRHVAGLLAAVAPMTRVPEPAALAARRRFGGAVTALHAAGVFDAEVERRWRSRGLAAGAPWLDPDELDRLGTAAGVHVIAIPPTSPEEQAADAAATQQRAILVRRGRARQVFVPDRPRRRDGLALVAVVTRTEATEVLFHHVGPPRGDPSSGHAEIEALSRIVDALVPPRLEDDVGTRYAPVTDRPVSAQGTGGLPDPERPHVITGAWRYQPPAPDAATAFSIHDADAEWRLAVRSA